MKGNRTAETDKKSAVTKKTAMKNKKTGMLLCILWMSILIGTLQSEAAAYGPGAVQQPLSGYWLAVNGKWTYQTAQGPVRNSWALIGSERYCFNAEGVMLTGWQLSGSGKWYYLRQAEDRRMGAMERGFLLDPADGNYYYMDPDTGAMCTGWVVIDGSSYFFSTGCGRILRRWDPVEKCWVGSQNVVLPEGAMLRNIITEEGYLFDNEGVFVKIVSTE